LLGQVLLLREAVPITIYDLVCMLSTKANANILSKLSFIELMPEQEMRSLDVTWSILYYQGVVTFCKDSDCQGEGTHSLRVANNDMGFTVSPWNVVLRRVLIIDLVLAGSPTPHKLPQG